MKKIMLLLFGFFSLAYVSSCGDYNEEELFTIEECDTIDVNYATVDNILSGCQGCHAQGNASGGIILTNYETTRQAGESGRLLGAINHDAGFVAMPPAPGKKLNDCQIEQVQSWIENGYLE